MPAVFGISFEKNSPVHQGPPRVTTGREGPSCRIEMTLFDLILPDREPKYHNHKEVVFQREVKPVSERQAKACPTWERNWADGRWANRRRKYKVGSVSS